MPIIFKDARCLNSGSLTYKTGIHLWVRIKQQGANVLFLRMVLPGFRENLANAGRKDVIPAFQQEFIS
jgi:hypothetical protein